MATRKKKAEVSTEATVVKGSHLTVTTYPDGRTELEWDDAALLRDVQDAIKAYETTEVVGALALGEKPKKNTRN